MLNSSIQGGTNAPGPGNSSRGGSCPSQAGMGPWIQHRKEHTEVPSLSISPKGTLHCKIGCNHSSPPPPKLNSPTHAARPRGDGFDRTNQPAPQLCIFASLRDGPCLSPSAARVPFPQPPSARSVRERVFWKTTEPRPQIHHHFELGGGGGALQVPPNGKRETLHPQNRTPNSLSPEWECWGGGGGGLPAPMASLLWGGGGSRRAAPPNPPLYRGEGEHGQQNTPKQKSTGAKNSAPSTPAALPFPNTPPSPKIPLFPPIPHPRDPHPPAGPAPRPGL